jgi:glycosyltransferase involved in cell wall biosynthesis
VNQPWLSVLLPTYNGQAYLGGTLESVARQGDDGIEVIAIDDGSTDGTPALLRSFARHLNLRILERARTGNWVANTNHALAAARGDYIGILHQDDVWAPGRLAHLKRALAKHPGTTWLFHASWYVDSRGGRLAVISPPFPPGVLLAPELLVERLLVQDSIMVPSAIVRREAALAVGGLDESLPYSGDWDFWLRIAAAGGARFLSLPLAHFRIHALSQTNASTSNLGEYRRQQEAVLGRHFRLWSSRLRRPADIHLAARFSIEVNVAFSSLAHRQPSSPGRLLARFLRLGPWVGFRYLRDSRIRERVYARLHLLRAMKWRL